MLKLKVVPSKSLGLFLIQYPVIFVWKVLRIYDCYWKYTRLGPIASRFHIYTRPTTIQINYENCWYHLESNIRPWNFIRTSVNMILILGFYLVNNVSVLTHLDQSELYIENKNRRSRFVNVDRCCKHTYAFF